MAKKKKTSSSKSQKTISPERYIKEKARQLPIGQCLINREWQANGLAHIFVTRPRPNGELVLGDFLVDTYCLGVKDAFYTMKGDKSSLEYFLTKGFVEIPYEEAHNIIYGAISFAEDAGIEPHKNFEIGQYILEEDTEDIPLIDYEFGRDGKYFLVVGQDYKERVYINTLKERLGDNFEFLLPIDDDEYDLDDEYDEYDDDDVVANAANKAMLNTIIDRMNNRERTPDEEYSYKHPSYPSTLTVRHQFIADAFSDKNNFYRLPDDIIAKIHALPVEEAISDIYNIVMYEIGRTYKAIDDGTINDEENGSIVHSLIMLSMLKSPDGLEAVLEIMRQNSEFADYHLGDLAPEIIPQALYACCKDYIQPMLAYMYASGFESYLRSNCLDALGMIAINNPERRPEVIEILRQLLISMVDRLPKLEACDGTFAGFVMSLLVDLKAKELIPEIKKVYETDCVDDGVTGDFDDIIKCLEGKEEFRDTDRYEIQTPEEIYKRIENFN